MTACCARTPNSSTTMMSPAAIPTSATTTPSSPSLNKVPLTIQVPSDHTTSLLVNSSTTSTAPAVVPVEVHVVKPAAAAATAAASPSDSPQVCRRRRILDQAKQQARCDESTASRSTTASHSRSTTSRQRPQGDVQPRRPPRVIACPETEWRPAVRPQKLPLPVPTIAYKTTKEELQQLEYAKRCLAEHRRAVKLKIRMARQERLQQRFAAGVFTFVEAVTDAAPSAVNVNVNDGNVEEEDDINSLESASRHSQNENGTSSDDSGSDSSDDDDDDDDNVEDSESYTTESSLASSLLKSLAKKHGVPLPSTLSVAAAEATTNDRANNKKAKGDKADDEYLAALSSMLVQTARKAITESQHQRLLPLSTTSVEDTRPTDTTSSKEKAKKAKPPVGMARSMSVPDIFHTLSARELIDSFQSNNNTNTGATKKKNRRASLNHVFFSTPPQESQDYPSTWAPITPTFPTKQQRASITAKHQQQRVATNTKPLETSADKDDYRISADVNRAASSRSLVADVQPSLARIFPTQKQQPLKAKSERHLMMSKDDDNKEDDMMMLSSKSKPTSNNVQDMTVNQFLENPLYNPFDFDPSSTTKAVDPTRQMVASTTTTTPTKNKSQPPPPPPQKQRRSSKLWKLLRRRKSIG